MPGPFAPNDNLVGPICHQIAVNIQTQIPSIQHVYEQLPENPPGDNTVTLRLAGGEDIDETSGKIQIRMTYRASHFFRRSKIGDAYTRAYTYVTPWLNMLAAWPNQSLGGLSRTVTTKKFNVIPLPASGQAMVALVVDFQVLTEFNIPLT